MMDNPYFHEMDVMQWKALSIMGTTWGEIIQHYQAPDWCGAGQSALEGAAGCWSLVGRRIRCEADCYGCDMKIVKP